MSKKTKLKIQDTTRYIKVPIELYQEYVRNETTVYKGTDYPSTGNTRYKIVEFMEGTITIKDKDKGSEYFVAEVYVKRGTLASWMTRKGYIDAEDKRKKDYEVYIQEYKQTKVENFINKIESKRELDKDSRWNKASTNLSKFNKMLGIVKTVEERVILTKVKNQEGLKHNVSLILRKLVYLLVRLHNNLQK